MNETPAYESRKWRPRHTFIDQQDLSVYGRRSAPNTMDGPQPKMESFIEMGR